MKTFAVSIFSALCIFVSGTPAAFAAPSAGVHLSPAQLDRVGQRIWQNECAGSVAGLTSWNKGEDFASLGIGHFIWYPPGRPGPFEESFPPLLRFLRQHGADVPAWLAEVKGCPWATRAAFVADADSPRQRDLRRLLSSSVGLQTQFIIARLQAAQPKMLGAASRSGRARVQANFEGLLATPEGAFCLIDYVNFKGEGTNPAERYNGEGWGLLQVLERMAKPTPGAFAAAAKATLSRRVENAPPARGEQRWLPGWHNRCDGYLRKL